MAGGSTSGHAQAANSQVQQLGGQLAAVRARNRWLTQENTDLIRKMNVEKSKARNAVAAARHQVAREYRRQEAALNARGRALAARKAALDRRERKVTGLEHAWAANTIPGDGIFLVGSDIEPGTYKAPASANCYYARLASLNTSDIIDNNNVSGPVVIEVLPSDKALELSGCANFHKVG